MRTYRRWKEMDTCRMYIRYRYADVSTVTCKTPFPLFVFFFFTVRDSYMLNVDFEGVSVRELADPSLHNWVHHVQYVLPQVGTAADCSANYRQWHSHKAAISNAF